MKQQNQVHFGRLITALGKARRVTASGLIDAVTVARAHPGPGYIVSPGAKAVTIDGLVLAQVIDGKVRAMPVYETTADGLTDMKWGTA